MSRLPTLFLSHGSPMLAIQDSATGRFLDGLGQLVPRPRAIVVASAHYASAIAAVGGEAKPRTVYDFSGFPTALNEITYPAPGEPNLAAQIATLVRDAGFDVRVDVTGGIDHGVWVPLRRMYPEADIPVVPLAINPRGDASRHHALGAALAPLRDQGVLLIGSGGFVHNLSVLSWHAPDAAMPDWARDFADWMHVRLATGDVDALLDWQRRAPHARNAHPTVEHLMPLFMALGAAGNSFRSDVLHRSHEYGSLALDAFAFA